jgi:predicted MFS family arabinose efflux permease
VATPLLVLAMTGSPAAAGLSAFAFGLPMVALTLPAGAILDRVDRNRVMQVCVVARCLASASIVVGLWGGWLSFVQVVLVAVVGGVAQPFFMVGERSALRHLVPAPRLQGALAQVSAREFTGLAAGQALGGLLFGLNRLLPFLADAVSYLVSLVSLLLIRRRFQEDRACASRALPGEIAEGLIWAWRHPFVRTTSLLSAGLDSITNALYLAVIVAAQRRGASPAVVGVLLGFIGLGGLAGSLIATRARRFSLRQVVLVTLGTSTVLASALAIVPNPLAIGAILGAMFVFHPAWSASIGAWQVRVVPDQLLSRVQSAILLTASGAVPPAQLLVGILLQALGPRPTILLLAAVLLAVLGAALLSRSLDGPPDLPSQK